MQANEAASGQQAGTTGASMSVPEVTSKCAKCHGPHGEGVKKNPVLAGLAPEDFIERMNQYKTGAREHKIMAKFAKSLTDEEIAELAAYYHGLPAKSPE